MAPLNPAESSQPRVENVASAEAKVGVQVGILHGNVNYYQSTREAAPPEQFAAGCRNLEVGAPREAEKLIRAAITAGYTSNRVQFFYALSLVAGRTMAQVMAECHAQLYAAVGGPALSADDEFGHGLRVVHCFLAAHDAIYLEQSAESQAVERAVTEFRSASETVRLLIINHLDCLLTGVLEEQVLAFENADIDEKRLGNDRINRAVKFFIADPMPPVVKRWTPLPAPLRQRVQLMAGAAMVVFAIAGLAGIEVVADLTAAIVSLLLTLGLGVVAAWGQLTLIRHEEWNRRLGRRLKGLDTWHSRSGQTQDEQIMARFAHVLGYMYDLSFEAAVDERDLSAQERWLNESSGIRTTLLWETIWYYASICLGAPEKLHAIVRSQAESAAEQWSRGELGQWTIRRRKPRFARLAWLVGLWGFILICLGTVLRSLSLAAGATLAVVVILVLGLIFLRKAGEIDPKWKSNLIRHWVNLEYDLQRRVEQEAVEAWLTYLADRPSDAQMEEWLELDRRFIRRENMSQFNLRARDVISHLLLTEAAEGCSRARVIGGPPRYSDYIVRTFILTETGVRQVATTLDFTDGSWGDQQRVNFSYQSLASASVLQHGRQSRARARVNPFGHTRSAIPMDSHDFIKSRFLRLTLVSGSSIDVQLESYQDWGGIDQSETAAHQAQMAYESSGVGTALAILEAVAAEGPGWMTAERRRYAELVAQNGDLAREQGAIGTPEAEHCDDTDIDKV